VPNTKKNKKHIPTLRQALPIRSQKLTEKQKEFLRLSLSPKTKIIFLSGPAGSTKTYMAVYSALRWLSSNNELDLLYVRTIIESAEKNMGSLPGTADEKFDPYLRPLYDKLEEMLAPADQEVLRKANRLLAVPVNYLRGANWKDKIVVADEAQNFTTKELITLITRIGEGSKLFICGDFLQSDINGKTGFKEIAHIFNDEESRSRGIEYFEFNKDDILRSEILKFIIEKLEDNFFQK
jgi:phosphate starvation-inducible PhoH-like protein